MKTLTLDSFVDIADVYAGSLRLLPPIAESVELGNFAKKIVEEAFEALIEEIDSSHLRSVELFIKNATHCKSTFTNSKTTEDLLRSLISKRYPKVKQGDLLFDVPRLRIIPNSDIFSSGISYNYLPHRDTWYGAGHNQVNHWMALSNVTPNSTFYMAPSFFEAQISNSSSEFDLDTWNDVHRPQAGSNVATESRQIGRASCWERVLI